MLGGEEEKESVRVQLSTGDSGGCAGVLDALPCSTPSSVCGCLIAAP